MRFGILVFLMAVCGAVAGGVLPALYPAETSDVERTVSNAATKVIADPSELNPLRWIFDDVKSQVESGANRSEFPVGKPVEFGSFPTVTPSSQFHFDNDQQNAFSQQTIFNSTQNHMVPRGAPSR